MNKSYSVAFGCQAGLDCIVARAACGPRYTGRDDEVSIYAVFNQTAYNRLCWGSCYSPQPTQLHFDQIVASRWTVFRWRPCLHTLIAVPTSRRRSRTRRRRGQAQSVLLHFPRRTARRRPVPEQTKLQERKSSLPRWRPQPRAAGPDSPTAVLADQID